MTARILLALILKSGGEDELEEFEETEAPANHFLVGVYPLLTINHVSTIFALLCHRLKLWFMSCCTNIPLSISNFEHIFLQ